MADADAKSVRAEARRLLSDGRAADCLSLLAVKGGALEDRDRAFLTADALIRGGRADEASPPMERLLGAVGDDPQPALQLCARLIQSGRARQALAYTDQMIARGARSATLHALRADIFKRTGEKRRRFAEYQAALRLDPMHVQARYGFAVDLTREGQFNDAAKIIAPLFKAGKANADAHSVLALTLMNRGRQAEGVAAYKAALEREPDKLARYHRLLFAMNHDSESSQADIHDVARRYAQRAEPDTPVRLPRRAERERLRVGLVSADFRLHSVYYFLKSWLPHVDRERLALTLVHTDAEEDAGTAWLRDLGFEFISAGNWSDERLVETVRARELDIALDLSGHTAGNRLAAFARRIAPVQTAWLGYPNTTGLSAMDFRITDARVDPEGGDAALYSERLVRMAPPFVCYAPPDDRRDPVAEPPCRASGRVTFGCFNKLWKATPDVFDAWRRLLDGVPQSQLLLKGRGYDDARTRDQVRKRFADAGLDAQRVRFVDRTEGTAEHLALYNSVDLALDTFPYNGTTTTCEALAMGAPVLGFAGDRHAARVTGSFYEALGIDDLAFDSREAMIEGAIRIAADPDAVAALRRQVLERFPASPLCDGADFARRFQAALEHIAEIG